MYSATTFCQTGSGSGTVSSKHLSLCYKRKPLSSKPNFIYKSLDSSFDKVSLMIKLYFITIFPDFIEMTEKISEKIEELTRVTSDIENRMETLSVELTQVQAHVETLKAEKQSTRTRITVCEEKIKALRETVSKHKNPEALKGGQTI